MQNTSADIRPETLQPFKRWEKPLPTEIRMALSLTDWTAAEFANRVGVQTQMAYRWMRENEDGSIVHPINYAAWAILCHQAGLGKIW